MVKPIGLPGIWPGPLLAGFLLIFGILATLAPCPWGGGVADLRQQPVVLHHHPQLTDPGPGVHRMTAPGYSTAATPAEACPYDLMHALYGVLKPARFSVRPATLSRAIVITLAQPQLNAPVTVLERSDPPPRLV